MSGSTSAPIDLFKVLGAGARFDKKRFKEDLNVFNSAAAASKSAASKAALAASTNEISKELDFFGIQTAATPSTVGKKVDGKKGSKKADRKSAG
ncbi:hypothetical protein HDU76_002142, partial [Blyttiomyces sp. JEL0837]